MSRKFIQIKGLLMAVAMLTAAMTGCGNTSVDEVPNTPESEYVEMEASESNSAPVVNIDSVDEKEVISETEIVNDEQQVVDVTLDDLTEAQLEIFRETSISFVESVRDGAMSINDLVPEHDLIIDVYIMMNELPQNGKQLFNEWKDSVGYYEKLTAWINDTDTVSTDEIIEPDYTKIDSGVEVTQQTNKPQSSESQVKEQAKDAQERVSGTTTDNSGQNIAIGHDGKPATNIHTADETIGSFEDSLIKAIMAREGLSYAEAQAKAQEIIANSN